MSDPDKTIDATKPGSFSQPTDVRSKRMQERKAEAEEAGNVGDDLLTEEEGDEDLLAGSGEKERPLHDNYAEEEVEENPLGTDGDESTEALSVGQMDPETINQQQAVLLAKALMDKAHKVDGIEIRRPTLADFVMLREMGNPYVVGARPEDDTDNLMHVCRFLAVMDPGLTSMEAYTLSRDKERLTEAAIGAGSKVRAEDIEPLVGYIMKMLAEAETPRTKPVKAKGGPAKTKVGNS